MTHHARNSLPQPLVNGWAGRDYKSAKELHPGCDKYWFLPGLVKYKINHCNNNSNNVNSESFR